MNREIVAFSIVAGLVLFFLEEARAESVPLPDVCRQQQCVFALRSDIEAQIKRAYESGKAEGLNACRIRSGSWTRF